MGLVYGKSYRKPPIIGGFFNPCSFPVDSPLNQSIETFTSYPQQMLVPWNDFKDKSESLAGNHGFFPWCFHGSSIDFSIVAHVFSMFLSMVVPYFCHRLFHGFSMFFPAKNIQKLWKNMEQHSLWMFLGGKNMETTMVVRVSKRSNWDQRRKATEAKGPRLCQELSQHLLR